MVSKTDTSLLLDYYGAFLTDRQRELMRMNVDEDMSLAEIAEAVGVSRQGVRDTIAHGLKQLTDCDDKLRLVERDRKTVAVLVKLEDAVQDESVPFDKRELIRLYIKEIRSLLEDKDGV